MPLVTPWLETFSLCRKPHTPERTFLSFGSTYLSLDRGVLSYVIRTSDPIMVLVMKSFVEVSSPS